MKTKLIKTWYLVVLFFIWIGTMFFAFYSEPREIGYGFLH